MNTFVVTNTNDFATILRRNVVEELSLAKEYKNLDELISIPQILQMITKYTLGLDEDRNPILNEDIDTDLFDEALEYVSQIHLCKLCAADKLQCAWDDESNEMVFWADK